MTPDICYKYLHLGNPNDNKYVYLDMESNNLTYDIQDNNEYLVIPIEKITNYKYYDDFVMTFILNENMQIINNNNAKTNISILFNLKNSIIQINYRKNDLCVCLFTKINEKKEKLLFYI